MYSAPRLMTGAIGLSTAIASVVQRSTLLKRPPVWHGRASRNRSAPLGKVVTDEELELGPREAPRTS